MGFGSEGSLVLKQNTKKIFSNKDLEVLLNLIL